MATDDPDSYTSSDTPDNDGAALYKGPGPDFAFTELDMKPVDSGTSSGQAPHPIEGEWTGVCVLNDDPQTAYQGSFSIVIRAVVSDKFEGKGETYLGPVNIVGELQTPDCVETTAITLIDVTFKMKSAEYADFECKGRLCPETRTIRGEWRVSAPEDDSEADIASHNGSINDDNNEGVSADSDGHSRDPLNVQNEDLATPETGTCSFEASINDTATVKDLEEAEGSENGDDEIGLTIDGSEDGGPETQEDGSVMLDDGDRNSHAGENHDPGKLGSRGLDDDDLSVSDASDESVSESGGIKGRFFMTGNTPNIIRFRPLIDNPTCEPSFSVARKRWAYAIEVVLFDYRQRKGSLSFVKARLEERRKWIEFTIRSLLDLYTESTRGFLTTDMKKVLTLFQWQIHPSNARLFQAMANYLHGRLIHWR